MFKIGQVLGKINAIAISIKLITGVISIGHQVNERIHMSTHHYSLCLLSNIQNI